MGRRVREVMTQDVVTVDEHASFKEVTKRLTERRVSALPVLDRGGPRGRDRLPGRPDAQGGIPRGATGGPAVRASAPARDPRQGSRRHGGRADDQPGRHHRADAGVAEAARLLHHHHGIKRLPVVDPAGPLLGIVSRADLLKVFLRSDPDIVREVRQQVLVRAMWIDPDTVRVNVRDWSSPSRASWSAAASSRSPSTWSAASTASSTWSTGSASNSTTAGSRSPRTC
jgi:CBS domain-containing protein